MGKGERIHIVHDGNKVETKMTKKSPSPEPRTITLKSSQYQPKKAEKEVETDIPGMTDDQLRDIFFRPFKIKEED